MTVTNSSTTVLLAKHWGPQRQVRVVREPTSSLGISIVGGKVDLYNSGPESESAISGIFIKNVLPHSPAGKTGELKAGDRILEVDGVDLRYANHERAVAVIRAAGNEVTFLVQSLLQWNNDAGLLNIEPQVKINSQSPPRSSSRKESSSEESEDDDDDDEYRDMEGRTRTAAGVEISRASAGNVKWSKEEAAADPEKEDDFGYTANKIKKKWGNLGAGVVMVEVKRGSGGLGISLAGHKDRTKMAVLICGLNPKGLAHSTGKLQVGDEILEVNGVVLHGRCHLNASAIIKSIPGPIYKIIVLRRNEGLEDLSVKPITQFPVSLDDETPEQRYSSFKGVRTIQIKKSGGQGLGIMIIEGKHAEVGQGIFISDIQDGSAAQQAGLVVGDMILMVNKDDILGAGYDTAASLLKKTEGIVTLIVCNPNKAKDEDKKELTAAGTPTPKAGDKKLGPPGSVSPSPSGKLKEPDNAATAPITPSVESIIEINRDKAALGISVIGGTDTPLGGIVVHEIYPESAAAKDGRLKPGDQLLEVNSEDFKNTTISKALATLRQAPAKVRMVVYRDESCSDGKGLEIIEVELAKKPAKGLGLSVVGRKSGPGVFISELLQGGTAAADGRLMKGDQILEVSGQDLKNASQEEAAAVLKTCSGKVAIKFGRYKARKNK